MGDAATPPTDPAAAARGVAVVGRIIRRHALDALVPTLAACETLAGAGDGEGAPLDAAVLGQFKSGKSSLLNAVLGADLLPVGVLPVTAVVTRLYGGAPARASRQARQGA